MATLLRSASEKIYGHACSIIPGGVNSPVRSFKEVALSPMIVKRGKGDMIWDVDGHSYIDFCMSWGALILGHSDDTVIQEVTEQMHRGTSFGITTEVEVEMASLVTSLIPNMEMIRFVSSGTEAVMSALRLSRGFTGKNAVIKYSGNYHGHSDMLLVQAGSGATLLPAASSSGVPQRSVEDTICLPYNDIDATRHVLQTRDDIACVILEPVAANMGVVVPSKEFLSMLREETKKRGIVLIFDEVITGFRLGLRGSFDVFGIIPDLYCLGKIVGGGLPAAAFGGRRDIMSHLAPLGGVYQAGTLSGSPLAMRAGLATLRRISTPNFYRELKEKADFLLQPIEEAIRSLQAKVQLQRIGSMFTLFFSERPIRSREDLSFVRQDLFATFFRFLFTRGIYFAPSQYEANFISSAHTEEHLRYVRDTIIEFLKDHRA